MAFRHHSVHTENHLISVRYPLMEAEEKNITITLEESGEERCGFIC